MIFSIRPCEPDDVDAVRGLSRRLAIGVAPWRGAAEVRRAVGGWLEVSTSSDFEGAAFVAADATSVVGFASVSTLEHFSGEVDAYIGELLVAETVEGTGVGTQLLEAMQMWAHERGFRCITLTTGAANLRAISFYERHGYVAEDVKLTKVFH